MARFFRGENELYKIIKEDHQKIQTTLEQIENSTQSERPHLFATLKRELLPHMKAEEKAFYPILRDNLRTHEDYLIAAEGHQIAESILNDMSGIQEMDATWKAKATLLKIILDSHIKMEEGRVFENSSKAIPEDHFNEMAVTFKEEKSRVQSATLV